MFVRLLKDWQGYEENQVIQVSDALGEAMQKTGIAKEVTQDWDYNNKRVKEFVKKGR